MHRHDGPKHYRTKFTLSLLALAYPRVDKRAAIVVATTDHMINFTELLPLLVFPRQETRQRRGMNTAHGQPRNVGCVPSRVPVLRSKLFPALLFHTQ